MKVSKELEKELKTDYHLVPMADITEEARVIAVRWMECGDRDFIREKHKLASDIMNYARRVTDKQNAEWRIIVKELTERFAEYQKIKNDEITELVKQLELLKNKPA